MIPSTMPAVSMPMPIGGPLNSGPMIGLAAEVIAKPWLDMGGHEGREHEQSPHAVDDAGDGGEQLDRDRDRAARPARRDVGQEQGDADADRNRDDQRDRRSDERPVDRNQRAEMAADRVPVGAGDEAPAERLEREPAAPRHRQRDARRAGSSTNQAAPAVISWKARSAPAPLFAATGARLRRCCGGRRVHLTFCDDVALDLLHEVCGSGT